jgi:hypothetical protein
MMPHRHELQTIASWVARRMGRSSADLAVSDPRANKAETIFRRCRVGCGEIRFVLNIRFLQAVLSSSKLLSTIVSFFHSGSFG